jgi:hypothetical protein
MLIVILSSYIVKSSTAFYVSRVTRIYVGWAIIYGTAATEPKTASKDLRVGTKGGGFCQQESLPPSYNFYFQTTFLFSSGVFLTTISPQAFMF